MRPPLRLMRISVYYVISISWDHLKPLSVSGLNRSRAPLTMIDRPNRFFRQAFHYFGFAERGAMSLDLVPL